MIEELEERIVEHDRYGNAIAAAPPDNAMIVDKVNEIIRYLNDEDNRLAEADKTLEEAAEDSWALYEYRETPQGLYSSCYQDGFIAGAEWQKKQDAARRK